MQRITYLSLFFITFSGLAQKTSILKGRIITDTIQLEAIHVVNYTQEIGAITDKSGYFDIMANPGDKIIFSSVQFSIKEYIVTEKDIQEENLLIFLEPLVNELDEVQISQYSLSGDIKKDIKKIPTYEDNLPLWNAKQLKNLGVTRPNDAQSPVENLVLGNGNSQASISIDLGLLINLISGVFKKKPEEVASKTHVLDFYKEEFFIKELKIPETEFYNFLDFLNEETGMRYILTSKDGLKILEFLIHQSEKFKEKNKIRK
ncbi:hypothetical protein [Aquimarina sp. 2201CG14-23]|uniref:hypothetical protein n=1 Tax=Aquimarina mycalae TaxID=3040073 RepID=UPI002478050B|nr:hypothetical protein [Aquimarina sp. 2201CG14-23]MDH7448380.1 hypothetical protein [Aquimarina sp. 2201CG14-23]